MGSVPLSVDVWIVRMERLTFPKKKFKAFTNLAQERKIRSLLIIIQMRNKNKLIKVKT